MSQMKSSQNISRMETTFDEDNLVAWKSSG